MAQQIPRPRHNCYPFIYPSKFRGALKDKVTLITGAAGELGKSAAECFAVAGAKLVLTYFRTEPETKGHFTALGASDVLFIQCDVGELESCEKMVNQVLEFVGHVDILVNNAGANALVPFHTEEPQNFVHGINVNLNGPYYLMRLLMPKFREQRSGCVINIASRAGVIYAPFMASYCASKAALINLTGCVQRELDIEGFEDIHVYALHPGAVRSVMTINKYKNADKTLPENPEMAKRFSAVVDDYNDQPHLNGMVCVALATGIAKKILRGKYFDVGQDLEDVIAQGEYIQLNPDLYSLHASYIGDPMKDDGKNVCEEEKSFVFPGF